MQYHLNGFRPGDPDVHEASPGASADRGTVQSEVDVLIVGCGPAGLTLASQLSAFSSIDTRIVEARTGPLERGHADGVSVRSMEMFQAFGFADRIKRDAYWVNETTFWKPDPENPRHIIRAGRVKDVEQGLSEMPHVILNQARIHDMYLDIMRNSPRRLEPDYGRCLRDLTVTNDNNYPVAVTLERLDKGHEGETEVVHARYVVGCDGARSTVREQIGRKMDGDFANQAWGVMDVFAVTGFPDIRFKSLIQSDGHGNIVLIPREGGYLARFYVEMDKLAPDERARTKSISVGHLIEAANRILSPYALDVKDVAWWSVYEIGQRLTDRFDDSDGTRDPRVFIAGDACHTHSPKAGQGMNVSMGDAFNLGWKLASVLEGRSPTSLLRSYSEERQAVAKDLIDFDREWTKVLTAHTDGATPEPQAVPKFQRYFIEHGRYTAGTAVRYSQSRLTGDDSHQHLAAGYPIGMRFHSAPVIRHADAKLIELGHTIVADGRWRLFAFADAEETGLRDLFRFLDTDPSSPIRRYTPVDGDPDSVIDLRAVFQCVHTDLPSDALPGLLHPRKGRFGLIDYEKVFCVDQSQDIFDLRGIDRDSGCLVIVRPDQYVADVLPLGDFERLGEAFLETLSE
ncbi:MAG: FAD-binding monooxygenase [Silicimonas sp.]